MDSESRTSSAATAGGAAPRGPSIDGRPLEDRNAAKVDPVLASAQPGDLVGVEVSCPRFDCDWREPLASAEVVNEYGVRDPLPRRCRVHGLYVRMDKIVEVVR